MGGGIGGTIADIMGGQDEYHQDTPKTDLGKYGYGDSVGAYNWMQQGNNAQGRSAAQINGQAAGQMRDYGLQTRGQQNDALGLMQAAALGQAPSAAQIQLQQGRDAAMQNYASQAASVRGGGANLAAAQMAAQRQSGEMMGQANQQAAQLRAQEMAQARGAYAGAAAQQRAQDLQAQGLDFQSAQAQAQLEQQQHAQNDAYSMGLYGLGQHSADQEQMGGIRGQEDVSGNELAAGQVNAQVAGINAGAASQGGSQALGTAAGALGAMAMFSDERLKRDVRPIGGTMGGPPESRVVEQQRLARMQGMMGGGGSDPYSKGMQFGANLGALMAGGGADTMGSGVRPGRSEAELNAGMGPNMGAPGGSAVYDISGNAANMVPAESVYSDERLKTGLHPMVVSEGTKVNSRGTVTPLYSDARLKSQAVGGGNAVDSFMGSLHPVSYHYKPGVPGEDPHAARYGILAQDVAQTPMGRSLVEKTPVGLAINVPHATGALMAGEGELYARQQRLEQQLAHLRRA